MLQLPPRTELASDDYESLEAMADADNQAVTTKPREECTADIRLLFYCEKKYIHPITGKSLDGHWCKVCQADPSVKETSCFLTGSTSSLHMHIARNHVDLYRKHCKAFGVEPHPHTLFRSPTESSMERCCHLRGQGPIFTSAGVMDYIIKLVILEDEAFCLVDRSSFHQLLKFCRPLLLEQDIPHRHALHVEILRHAEIAKCRVRDNLKKVPSKISFTFDAWTSTPGDPYRSLTSHIIDAPADHPNAWELKSGVKRKSGEMPGRLAHGDEDEERKLKIPKTSSPDVTKAVHLESRPATIPRNPRPAHSCQTLHANGMDLLPEPPSASQALIPISRPPPKPNIRDDAAVATAAAIATGVATTLQIAPVHPTDYLEKTPLPYEKYIKVLKAETIEAIQGPLMYHLGGKLESWEGEEFRVSLNNFHAACDIILTALESGYYLTRSKTLLSATEWAELLAAALAATARLQAIDSACGDIDNHPFSNSFSCIIATADQISINLTADENESGLVSWLTQTETQVRFRAERLATAEVEEALLAWKKDQIERRSSAVEADIQRALRERNTELLHQTAKTLGVDVNPAPATSRLAPRAGDKRTVSGSAPIPWGPTVPLPPAPPAAPRNAAQPQLDERLMAALVATVQQALNPVLERMSSIEKAIPKPPTRTNTPRASPAKVSNPTASTSNMSRPPDPTTQPRVPEPDNDFIEVTSGKSRKARNKRKTQAEAAAAPATLALGAATPTAPTRRQINLTPSSYAATTAKPATSPPMLNPPSPPTPLLTEMTVLQGGCAMDKDIEKAIRARSSDSIVREVRATIARDVTIGHACHLC
ncbi:hypothetical protein EI94DRAFT_1798065 [Lactarius quietus]|nr:hypothetical protein EI94DRAFT_1798065 [Lactarius quietus]